MNLDFKCKKIRKDILEMLVTLGFGHIGGSLSVVELLVTLYSRHMRIDPAQPQLSGRDRLFVSKGHCGPAVYAVLSDAGFFPRERLFTLNRPGTSLPSHCDMHLTPGIDMTTGSLGQGFSCGVGASLGSRLQGDNATIYAIIGDGETQEGQIWESAMFAAAQKLGNLIAFTDCNGLQLDGKVAEICDIEPLAEKWRAFGWHVQEIDGHDCDKIDEAILAAKRAQQPSMVLLRTVKGKGVKFAEEAGFLNHSMTISQRMAQEALYLLEKSSLSGSSSAVGETKSPTKSKTQTGSGVTLVEVV